MWSFDDEENKQNLPEEGQTPPQSEGQNSGDEKREFPEDRDNNNYGYYGYENKDPNEKKDNDDFDNRDPYSRGGDFYTNYGNRNSNGGYSPKPPKKSPGKGLLPALFVCVVVFVATIAIGSFFGNGNLSLDFGKTTGDETTTDINGTSGTKDTTSGTLGITSTTATAPGITPGTTPSLPSVSYVQWDAAIVEKCLNASVLISVENVGSGSGVIYTRDGYILTNYHVVSNNESPISVTLFSGEVVSATYIYGDESNDIAVIKIEKNDCVYAEISTSDVTYMMPVMVIGNALGRGFNTTEGVISAPASEVYFSSTYETMTLIQVDAAVNSGNSGGGLFNTSGQLIGIVNSKLSGTTSSGATIESMGYAIPMSTVVKCVNDLRDYGYVTGVARLGVSVNNYLRIGNKTYTGVTVVKELAQNGSAALAGIKAEDVLYEINGEEITSFETLKKMLTAYSVGDTIEITVLRPTAKALKQTNPYSYLRECEEIKIELAFVEFNPNE